MNSARLRDLAATVAIMAALGGGARAAVYTNLDGTQSPGFVPELGGKPIGPGNPLSASGPNADQSATIAGRGWSVATGPVAIPANQQLDVVLTNPTGSGCTAVFTLRRYTNGSTTNLAFQSFTNPTTITTNLVNVGNRMVGAASTTGMSFGFAMRVPGAMGGTAGVSSNLFANSEEKIDVPIVVPPGRTFGVSITGLSGVLAGAVSGIAVTFVGYCLP